MLNIVRELPLNQFLPKTKLRSYTLLIITGSYTAEIRILDTQEDGNRCVKKEKYFRNLFKSKKWFKPELT
ncbi:hypothetical protein M2326_001654 [Flavobacterium sp. 7A]|nr:hypothetical protein [Flavobacterium sp. 7A]